MRIVLTYNPQHIFNALEKATIKPYKNGKNVIWTIS